MKTARTIGLVATLAITLVASSATPATAFRDRDCSDFKNQRQAQRFFKKHGGTKKRDPHGLDANHNGIACESSF